MAAGLDHDRVRFADKKKPKATWAKSGGRGHWYGLAQAREHLGAGPIYIVNGEPSVIQTGCGTRPSLALIGPSATASPASTESPGWPTEPPV